jgi:hypothetical protein
MAWLLGANSNLRFTKLARRSLGNAAIPINAPILQPRPITPRRLRWRASTILQIVFEGPNRGTAINEPSFTIDCLSQGTSEKLLGNHWCSIG